MCIIRIGIRVIHRSRKTAAALAPCVEQLIKFTPEPATTEESSKMSSLPARNYNTVKPPPKIIEQKSNKTYDSAELTCIKIIFKIYMKMI